MITEKAMRAAAKELNEVLGLDPVIDPKAKLNIVTDGVKSALPLIDAKNDEFSETTQAVIDEINGGGEEDEEEEEVAPKKKAKAKVAPVEEEEEEDEPEDEDEEESLEDQIAAAEKVKELAPIVKANAIFKPLVKKLPTFTKGSVLKAAMLELLAPEEEEEEEDEKPVKKGKKPVVEEDDDEETPKKKGTGKGKPASFTSTKESLGTTRMIECAKAMQNIKGSQTIDVVAATADAKFVKAGGSANVKQDKNIIKTLLPAAIEWGIITEKGGKLTNA
jgi:hypothetical protein